MSNRSTPQKFDPNSEYTEGWKKDPTAVFHPDLMKRHICPGPLGRACTEYEKHLAALRDRDVPIISSADLKLEDNKS